ncbi:2OG-Fe dioxygenase family protein [Vibrio sp. SCSIO 43136]|uniref:2OG-Fe dioxygenase family protein n=1 Tax=Vibrio sp. SCSIO 43136 TaxID=2819101 RepID=UPI00207552A2|nr:2OG-Fe dioxygenase family protein [Vibrio sp. SCSIO 43136]USD64140.1 2OG-Fe dioxygenase family protein [Vibrio sp. SCSIO 43136]
MLSGHESTLQLSHLTAHTIEALAPSFSHLPHTKHADGKYRLRRYSVVNFYPHRLEVTEKHDFVQSEDINHFQGDVLRQFDPIEPHILQGDAMLEMCQLFADTNGLQAGHEIEIHQIRITAIYDETPVAPEGVHQDGFDHIAIIGIDRHNVVGGEVMIYNDNHEAPFFRKVLENGEVAMLDDHKLWHNAQPIRSISHGEEGHMDVFVLTAKHKVTA